MERGAIGITIEIEGLYEINSRGQKTGERERLIRLFQDAFEEYPKLCGIFPQKQTRLAALEATLRFYTAYDLRYGKGYALDEQLREGVLVVESQNMHYSLFKHLLAGSYCAPYRKAMKKLTREERRTRLALFDELDKAEKSLSLPDPHLYVDFLGVAKKYQHQGRGKALMQAVCQYAEMREIPIMLFTNTQEDVAFYKGLGFQIAGVTSSERFKFTNTYLIR